jgi:predicted nucleic acid-binding protein
VARSKPKLALLDAGPIIGLYNEEDIQHKKCLAFFSAKQPYDYVVTQAVIAEAVYKIQKEQSVKAAVKAVASLLSDVANGPYILHSLDEAAFGRVRELRLKYHDHKKLDFADLSLVVAAENLQIGRVVTVDMNDFLKLQWKKKNKHSDVSQSFEIIKP